MQMTRNLEMADKVYEHIKALPKICSKHISMSLV